MLLHWLTLATAGTCTGLVGPFGDGQWSGALPNWDATSSAEARLDYDVPTAPAPHSEYIVYADTVDVDAVSFDWTYSYNHGYFLTEAIFTVETDLNLGVLHSGIGTSYEGFQIHSGATTVDLTSSDALSFIVEGDNYDGSFGLSGTLTLSGWSFESPRCDCEGVFDGAATEDGCGDCDDDPSNDCVLDCAGVWGGAAVDDMCGTCDDDPSNDCVLDCAGVWGGPAVEDMCGTCDDDAGNDCVPDCAGVWGGAAVDDMCGTCDADPYNDCWQDCAGEWGGDAVVDGCGTCDDDPDNDCPVDCAGVWGGPSVVDMCGICDDDPDNDCVRDCTGEWGGEAVFDMCSVCDDDPDNDCEQDCNGEWGGWASVDDCGECVGGSTGLSPCDPTTATGTTTDDPSTTDTATGDPATTSTDTTTAGTSSTTGTQTTPTAAQQVDDPIAAEAISGCACSSSRQPARLPFARR